MFPPPFERGRRERHRREFAHLSRIYEALARKI